MLEQNVPNPLAQNPSFHTHKVFAAIGIILTISIIAIGGIWYFVQSAEDKAPATEDNTVKVSTSSAKQKKSASFSSTSAKFKEEQIIKSYEFINSKGEARKLLIVSENGQFDTAYITDQVLSRNSSIKVKDKFSGCEATDIEALRSCFGPDSAAFPSSGPGKRFILHTRHSGDGSIFDILDETGKGVTSVQTDYNSLKLSDKCQDWCREEFGSWKDGDEFYLKVTVLSGDVYQYLVDAKTGRAEGTAIKL